MSNITVTATATEYTAVVSGGPANTTDWLGLYVVGDTPNNEIEWKYLSNSQTPPPSGLASATVTFPAQTGVGPFEVRLYENNGITLLATGAVPGAAPPAPHVITDGFINVADTAFAGGATGNPNGNDTDAIEAASAAAKATTSNWGSRGLRFPPGGVYVCTRPQDFLGISTIECKGWLVAKGPITAPFFKVGQPSQNVGNRHEFFGVYSLDETYNGMKYPLIQFRGMRGGKVELGSCGGFVEVYAEPGIYQSTHYTEFHLGQTWRLELRSPRMPDNSSDTGAINSNQFYGGALAQLRIGGPWVTVVSMVGKRIGTATAHNLFVGDLVEMYNGNGADVSFQLVTAVVDATHFDLGAPWAGSANPGNGWRCMGPASYLHNDNQFWCPDIEDYPALIHIQGRTNRLERCRMEASGTIAFSPHSFMNSVESSDTTHGHPPAVGASIDMTVLDFSGGKNYAGWVRVPKPWGSN